MLADNGTRFPEDPVEMCWAEAPAEIQQMGKGIEVRRLDQIDGQRGGGSGFVLHPVMNNHKAEELIYMYMWRDFPGGPVVRTSPSNVGGAGSIPGWGAKTSHVSRPKKTKHKTEAIISCLENPMDGGAW